MRYVKVTQRVKAPQCLQVCVRHRAYDVVLHRGLRRRVTGVSDAEGYAREYRNPAYYIWLYTDGAGTMRLNGATYPFHRGTLSVTNPGEPHTILQQCDAATTILGFGFTMVRGRKSSLVLSFHRLLSLWSGEDLPEIDFPVRIPEGQTRQLERLMDEYTGTLVPAGMIHYFPAHKALMDILCFLVEQVYVRSEPVDRVAGSPLMRVRIEIERRYNEKLGLRELGDSVSLSPEHLCRSFRREFGTSPIAYQQEIRLREAKSLLNTTRMRIGEIAVAVGYQSLQHFTRLFAEKSGTTPTEYRRGLAAGHHVGSGKSLSERKSFRPERSTSRTESPKA